MRKILSPVLALFLVLAVVPLVQAFDMCSPANPGSVEVTLSVDPKDVCPGEELTVTATIDNTGDCHDFFLVTIRMYHFEPISLAWRSEFPGRAWCQPLMPMLLVPLTAHGSFDFTYKGIIPDILPPGTYGLLLHAKGLRGGATDKASTKFTVLDCSGVCSHNGECRPDDYCKKAMGECAGQGHCSVRPEGCLDIWDPVCGCDGVTYPNACEASMSGVSVDYPGECTTDPAISCIQSGGTIRTGYCCKGSGDFPGTCLDGACTCAPEHSELVQMCDCGPGRCFNGSSCVPVN